MLSFPLLTCSRAYYMYTTRWYNRPRAGEQTRETNAQNKHMFNRHFYTCSRSLYITHLFTSVLHTTTWYRSVLLDHERANERENGWAKRTLTLVYYNHIIQLKQRTNLTARRSPSANHTSLVRSIRDDEAKA